MKKVAISTLVNNIGNFGAYLQAFTLQETLKKFGYDVEFIYYDEHRDDYGSDYQRKFLDDSRTFLQISKKKYNSETDKYDAIVIGSDEIWNLKNDTFEHFKEYFGYGLNCDKIIAYAPCANEMTLEDLKNYYNGEVDFSNFHRLSARDVNTKKLIEDSEGKEVPLVVDPTFLIDSYDKYFEGKERLNEDYVFLYGYNFSDEEKNKIIEFAKANNMKTYSMLDRYDWCGYLEGNMIDFIWNIKNANYVVTNTFHGTMFSMIFNKEFCVFPKNAKVKDVVNRYSLEDRNGFNVENVQKVFNRKIDYNRINELKRINVNNSLNYLKDSIEG